MRITLTGASGFLGKSIVRVAEGRNVAVRKITRRDIGSYFHTPGPTGEDDVLIHLAQSNRLDVEEDGDEAVRLVTHLTTLGYDRVCYASSAAVYGDRDAHPHATDEALVASSPYAAVKLRCEREVLKAEGLVLRLTNLFGAAQSASTVLARILAQIPGEGPLTVRSTHPQRDFCWVDDAADAAVSLCAAQASGIFNVGSGAVTSIGGVAQAALAVAGEGRRPIVAEEATGPASVLAVDITATTAACGWRPRTSLADGLRMLVGEAGST